MVRVGGVSPPVESPWFPAIGTKAKTSSAARWRVVIGVHQVVLEEARTRMMNLLPSMTGFWPRLKAGLGAVVGRRMILWTGL